MSEAAPESGRANCTPSDETTTEAFAPEEATVGTGSVLAVGCSIVTVLLILLGVAVFILLWLS